MPTVSVIMPAYNVEPYVADAVHSVLRQTYGDLEIIVADDGSTDGTGAIVEKIRNADPDRVRTMAAPRRGPSAARNSAFRIARGEYFAFLDSDDMWEPAFLERQMAIFAARPEVDLVTGNGRYLGGRWHGRPVRPWPDRRPPISLETIVSDEEAVFIMTVFRARVFRAIGGFDEALRGNEDFEFWLRAALAGFQFARNDEPLGWYRRREHSLSSDAVKMVRGALQVCQRYRPSFAGRPEADTLERQVAYYEHELDAAVARQALAEGDAPEAARALAALHARRPSLRTAVAAALARHASPVLMTLYQLKRAAQV